MVITSGIYFLLAAYILFRYKSKFSIFFSVLLLFVGIGATYLHLYWNLLGQFLDFYSIALIVVASELYFLHIKRIYKAALIILLGIYLVVAIFVNNAILMLSMIGLFCIFLTFYFVKKNYYKDIQFIYILTFLLIGILVWFLGDYKIVLGLNTDFPFHSLWHLISAIVLLYMFKFYNNKIYKFQSKTIKK